MAHRFSNKEWNIKLHNYLKLKILSDHIYCIRSMYHIISLNECWISYQNAHNPKFISFRTILCFHKHLENQVRYTRYHYSYYPYTIKRSPRGNRKTCIFISISILSVQYHVSSHQRKDRLIHEQTKQGNSLPQKSLQLNRNVVAAAVKLLVELMHYGHLNICHT